MNFQFINPHNVRWLVPFWATEPFELACAMEEIFAEAPRGYRPRRWNEYRDFCFDVDQEAGRVRLSGNLGKDNPSAGRVVIRSPRFQIHIPINYMLKGAMKLEETNCLYYHSFDLECPLGYFGVTKNRWFDRLGQHRTSAARGSPYLFHRSIREHGDKRMIHRVMLAGVDRDEVMKHEEDWVSKATLYPLGLNMIPGGYAGMRYLHTLGIDNVREDNRDEILEDLVSRESFKGRPNPLCAARWEADQDFVNRIICGHSGRLTVAEIRRIRELDLSGIKWNDIACSVGRSPKRVTEVLRGKTYRRVA